MLRPIQTHCFRGKLCTLMKRDSSFCAWRGLVLLMAFCLVCMSLPALAQEEAAASRSEKQAFDFANGLYQRGMYATAARHYLEFIRQHPQSLYMETALFRRGESLYQHAASLNNKPVEAQIIMNDAKAVFVDYINTYPNAARIHEARLRLGELRFKTGDARGALPVLQQVRNEAEDASLREAALFYTARSHERLEQFDRARVLYTTLREQSPQGSYTGLATYLFSELCIQEGDQETALTLLNQIWKQPQSLGVEPGASLIGDAQLRAAQLQYQMGQYEQATEAYLAFAEGGADESKTARALYGAAWSAFQREDYPRALEIANSLQRQLLPPDLVAGILFLQGTCSYQQGLYEDAIRFFREVIADPESGEYRNKAWYQLAWSYYLIDDLEQAAMECRNLLRLGIPPHTASNVHFLHAQVLADQDKLGQAVEELKMVEKLDPQGQFVPEARYLQGDLLYRNQEYPEAARAFRRFYDTYPQAERARDALTWTANAWFAAKDYPEAIEAAQNLLAAYPNHAEKGEFLYRIALAYYQQQQFDQALQAFDAVLQAESAADRHAQALYWQAYIYERRQERAQAAEVYGDLLARFPGFAQRDEVRLRKAFCEHRSEQYDAAFEGFFALLGGSKREEIPLPILFWMIVHADENSLHAEALQVAETILAMDPDAETRERALLAQGNQLVALERWEEAKQIAGQFLDAFPDSLFQPEIYWVKAKAEEGLGNGKTAAEWFEKSLLALQKMANPDPNFEAVVYIDLGHSLLDKGQTREALDSFLRVAILYDHPRLTPEAMYYAIQSHIVLEEWNEARTLMQELEAEYPDSRWNLKAQDDFSPRLAAHSQPARETTVNATGLE